MSWFSRAKEKVINAARWVANKVIKPTAKVINKAVNWVEDKVDYAYRTVKGYIDTVKDGLDLFGLGGKKRVEIPTHYYPQPQVQNVQPNYPYNVPQTPSAIDQYPPNWMNEMASSMQLIEQQIGEKRARLLREFEEEEAILRARQEQRAREIQAKHEREMAEVEKKLQDSRRLLEFINTLHVLADQANLIRTHADMQEFENFARLHVSTFFIKDLTDDIKTTDDLNSLELDKIQFLEYVRQFVSRTISENDYAKFDEMVMKLYKKDLLEFGTEAMLKHYDLQFKEKEQLVQSITRQSADLKFQLKSITNVLMGLDKTEAEKAELKKRAEVLEKLQTETDFNLKIAISEKDICEEMFLSMQTFLALVDSQEKLTDQEIEYIMEIGEIFIKHRDEEVPKLDPSEDEKIFKFNNWALAKGFISETYDNDLEIEG